MKNIVTIAILFLSLQGFSQGFNGGIYAGLAATQIDGDNYWGFNKAGPIVGGFVDTYFDRSKTWGAKFGLRYIEKGSNKSDNDNGLYYKAKLHYVEMPLSIRYMYNKKFEFEGGLSFGYLIKGKEDKDGYGMEDAEPPFNAFELAGFLGLSYHFNPKWAVSAQYAYSVLPIRSHSQGSDYTFRGQFNNYTMLCLNYIIEVK